MQLHRLLFLCLSLSACSGSSTGASHDVRPAIDVGLAQPDLASDHGATDGKAADQLVGDVGLPTGDQGKPPAIWQPKPGTTWQWQLTGTIDTSIDVMMYDVDLFETSNATISKLHADGRIVICYFSAGSYEAWRPDAGAFPSSVKGSKMDGWDELWLDVRAQAVRDIMSQRLDLAKSKGCDGVEPDNVDGFDNATGYPLTSADQLAYNKFLAAESHKRGLSVGLKNDLAQVKQLVSSFDWALNEECLTYNECNELLPFIQAQKAVFHVEYTGSKSSVCGPAKALGFDSMLKHLDLDAWYDPCW